MFNSSKKFSIKKTAKTLHTKILNRARRKEFYLDFGVADTVDGRFDMILIYAFLLFERLKSGEDPSEETAQAVFDIMFFNFDQNLREMGVGDVGVSHRIKDMAKALFGRIKSYEAALENNNPAVLNNALLRNLYRKTTPTNDQVDQLAKLIRSEHQYLNKQATADILDGKLNFYPFPRRQ